MQIISIPKPLREKLGEKGADALVEIINKAQDNQKTDIIEFVEEKFEHRLIEEISSLRAELKEGNSSLRAELKEDNSSLRAELKEDNSSLRAELKEDIASLRAELKYDIEKSRADLIKWMFIFWVGQVVTILGILFVFFG